MSIFVVIAQNEKGPAGTLSAKVAASGLPSYPLQSDVWLVSSRSTAQELCSTLGIYPEGTYGTAVVTEVGSYYGRANPAIWTWLKANWEGAVG